MMRLIGATIATAILFGAAPAQADFLPNFDGWYVEARAGIGLPPRPEAEVLGPGSFNGEWDEDDGMAAGVAVGAYFAPNWRGEVEFGWTHGEDGQFKVSSGNNVPHTGDADVYQGLVNVIREFPLQGERWRPYVGAGMGIAVFDFDRLGGGAFFIDDTEVTFNAAVHTGIDVPLNETFILTTRLTGGITTSATMHADGAAAPDVRKDTQFYGFFSAGIRIMLGGLTQ